MSLNSLRNPYSGISRHLFHEIICQLTDVDSVAGTSPLNFAEKNNSFIEQFALNAFIKWF